MESNRTVSEWPEGQEAGAPDSLMGRLTSNVSLQERHLNSYVGTAGNIVAFCATEEPDQAR